MKEPKPYTREFFQAIGRKHGAKGGYAAAANMTPEERREKAMKMVRARKKNPVLTDAEKAEREAAKKEKSMKAPKPKRRVGRPRKQTTVRAALEAARGFVANELLMYEPDQQAEIDGAKALLAQLAEALKEAN
jgi:hypothetical protein